MTLPLYKDLTRAVSARMGRLCESQPELMAAFARLAAAGTRKGTLDRKTRELVALGISVASRCDDCIGFHVKALLALGATHAEIEEVPGTAVYMGGGPSMMVATHALVALDELSSLPAG